MLTALSQLHFGLDVQRGPGWLLVTPRPLPDAASPSQPLADRLRFLLEQHSACRLVLDLSRVPDLDAEMVEQVAALREWIGARQGMMRLCGLSPGHIRALREGDRFGPFVPYRDYQEAVFAVRRPIKPR